MLDEVLPDEQSDAERELAPSVDVPDESDADPALQRQFWLLVVVFNVALMAVSVGAMLAVFRGQWDFGSSLVGAGLVLTGYGLYKYRVYKDAEADDGADPDPVDDPDATSASTDETDDSDDDSPGSVADLDANSDH